MSASFKDISVIGAGPIGRSWALHFLKHGKSVCLIDLNETVLTQAREWIEGNLGQKSHLTTATDIESGVQKARWIQECGPDDLSIKQSILQKADAHAQPDCIIGSSCSTLDPTALAQGLSHPERVLLVHPFNPPHILAAVEIVPGELTSAEIVDAAAAFMLSVDRSPIILNAYIEGLLINRLQGALMREAFWLYTSGVSDIESIDTCIADGLALRWISVGTFGTNHTNADGGIGEYFSKYPDWKEAMDDLTAQSPQFTPEFVDQLDRDVNKRFKNTSVPELAQWRDRLVQAVIDEKAKTPKPWER